MLKFSTSLFPNLITHLIIFGMIIHIGPKCFVQYLPHHPRPCHDQGHRLRIFMLKFYVNVFRTSFFYLIDKRDFRRAILSGDRSCSSYSLDVFLMESNGTFLISVGKHMLLVLIRS